MKALLLRAAILVFSSAPALASTATDNLAVSATIGASCSVVGASLDFGGFADTNVVHDATAAISVTCSVGLPYTVSLGAGLGAGATVTARLMTGLNYAGPLHYAVYVDAARTTNFDAASVSGVGAGTARSLTLYGRLPVQYAGPPDFYGDTLTITINY